MSRIGKHPVEIPSGVECKLDGRLITVKGKKASMAFTMHHDVTAALEDNKISFAPVGNSQQARQIYATTRTRVFNMVKGVTDGFEKKLEITGVGYRAQVKGKTLVLQLGYSHDVEYPIPEGIEIKAESPTALTISGHDKQQVGQVAAEIRGKRPPEPYKGKGVRYAGEFILRKEGKKK